MEQRSRVLSIVGPCNTTGYGVHTTKMVEALAKKASVFFIPISVDRKCLKKLSENNIRIASTPVENEPVLIIWHEHSHLDNLPKNKRIYFPVWELDTIPEKHANSLIALNDLIFVPSMWQKQSLIDSLRSDALKDLARKITKIVPEGVENATSRPIRAVNDDRLKFIHIGKLEARKNTLKIAQAFSEIDENAELKMYIFNPFKGFMVGKSEFYKDYYIKLRLIDKENIKILEHPLESTEMVKATLQDSHIAVFASSAEGWQLPVLEAMSEGLLVIATRNSGLTEYVSESNAIIVQSGPKETAYDGVFFTGSSTWDHVSVEAIKEAISRAVKIIRTDVSIRERAVETARSLSWDNAAAIAIDHINERFWKNE